MNNYYADQEMNENPPMKPEIEKLVRHILVEKPRVTKFQIDWDDQISSTPTGYDMMSSGMQSEMTLGEEGLMSKGTQFQDRNDMMSSANLAQAAQNFQLQ